MGLFYHNIILIAVDRRAVSLLQDMEPECTAPSRNNIQPELAVLSPRMK